VSAHAASAWIRKQANEPVSLKTVAPTICVIVFANFGFVTARGVLLDFGLIIAAKSQCKVWTQFATATRTPGAQRHALKSTACRAADGKRMQYA
jgi:hypothetical protein